MFCNPPPQIKDFIANKSVIKFEMNQDKLYYILMSIYEKCTFGKF